MTNYGKPEMKSLQGTYKNSNSKLYNIKGKINSFVQSVDHYFYLLPSSNIHLSYVICVIDTINLAAKRKMRKKIEA